MEEEVAAAEEVVVEEMVAAEMEIGVALTLGNDIALIFGLSCIHSFCLCNEISRLLLNYVLEVRFEVVYRGNCLYIVVGT